MNPGPPKKTEQCVSQAVRKDFFERYNGVVVKETVAFGHPTTHVAMSRARKHPSLSSAAPMGQLTPEAHQ
jgi:hypothetical protein